MTSNYPFVSVIIPMFNEDKYIEKCLISVMSQNYPSNRYEAIVVDGNSEDSSVEIVSEMSKLYNNIRILKNPHRFIPTALNIGIKNSSGEIIFIFNAHSIAPNDYISTCVGYLLETGIEHVSGGIKPVSNTYWGRSIGLSTSCRFGIGDSKLYYSQKEVFTERGFCGAYWKKTLLNIGLFDEEFEIGEDYELYLRLIKKGGKILLIPKVKMIYFCRDTLKKLFKQYFRYGFGKVKIFKKHKKVTSLRALFPAFFIIFNLLMILLILFYDIFFYPFITVNILYFSLIILNTIKISLKNGFKYLFSLPLVFLTLHTSHGLGFIFGTLNFFLLNKNK